MLWQTSYAELVFSDILWPDFRARELCECLGSFQQRERRFGQTGAQVHALPLRRTSS
jgi:undecaprenyl diphosphate synthase